MMDNGFVITPECTDIPHETFGHYFCDYVNEVFGKTFDASEYRQIVEFLSTYSQDLLDNLFQLTGNAMGLDGRLILRHYYVFYTRSFWSTWEPSLKTNIIADVRLQAQVQARLHYSERQAILQAAEFLKRKYPKQFRVQSGVLNFDDLRDVCREFFMEYRRLQKARV